MSANLNSDLVEIEIRADGKVVWISCEGSGVLRISNVKEILIIDNRTPESRMRTLGGFSDAQFLQ